MGDYGQSDRSVETSSHSSDSTLEAHKGPVKSALQMQRCVSMLRLDPLCPRSHVGCYKAGLDVVAMELSTSIVIDALKTDINIVASR